MFNIYYYRFILLCIRELLFWFHSDYGFSPRTNNNNRNNKNEKKKKWNRNKWSQQPTFIATDGKMFARGHEMDHLLIDFTFFRANK